jgi:phage host-nuclease inhibitor protein Gam
MNGDETETDHLYFRDDEPGDTETPDDGPAPDITESDHVQALGRCDWHLRRIGRLTRERDTLDAVYEAEIERLQDRHENRRAILQAAIAWHEAPLISYARMRRETDDVRTLELPHGVIRSTARPQRVQVDDEQTVADWAKDTLPDVVSWRPRIDKRALGAYVRASGEVPPGVTLVPPTTTYTVTPEGGDV